MCCRPTMPQMRLPSQVHLLTHYLAWGVKTYAMHLWQRLLHMQPRYLVLHIKVTLEAHLLLASIRCLASPAACMGTCLCTR